MSTRAISLAVAAIIAIAFAYAISEAMPGGGSRRHTLFRLPEHAGGLRPGHLARDSSAYAIAVRRQGAETFYEITLPWAELGGATPAFGSRLGMSLVLHDTDSDGLVARMAWGEGIHPAWAPDRLGLLTLVVNGG